MLLTAAQVNTSMNLSKEDIRVYIYAAGYASVDILTSEFKGMSTRGEFVYRISYQTDMTDMNDFPHEINVYLTWELDTNTDVLKQRISY